MKGLADKKNQPFRAFNQNISNIPTLRNFNSLKVDLSLGSKIEGYHFSIESLRKEYLFCQTMVEYIKG